MRSDGCRSSDTIVSRYLAVIKTSPQLQKYYGKMMNTHEELSSAADSFAEMYKEKQGNVPVVRRNTTTSIAPVSRRNTAATSLDGSRPSFSQTQSSGPSVVRGAVAAIAAATAAQQEAPPAPVSVAQAEHVKLEVGVQRSASSRASQDALSTELHTANWGRQVGDCHSFKWLLQQHSCERVVVREDASLMDALSTGLCIYTAS